MSEIATRESLKERIEIYSILGCNFNGELKDIPPKAIENALKFLSWIDDESIPFIGVFPMGEGDGINFESFDTDFHFYADVTADYIEQMFWNEDNDKSITIKISMGESDV